MQFYDLWCENVTESHSPDDKRGLMRVWTVFKPNTYQYHEVSGVNHEWEQKLKCWFSLTTHPVEVLVSLEK